MDLGLTGSTALITGGAQGIGAGVADRLIDEGVRVAVADLDREALVAAGNRWSARGAEPVLVPADLSSGPGVTDALSAVTEAFDGPPDLLVNNVGRASSESFLDIDDEQWSQTFELNFLSYVRTTRALMPAMARRPGSAIVNIASDLAKQPEVVPVDYGAMKAAVLYLTKATALEFAPAVRTNAVLPGPVWTPLWSRPGGLADKYAELYGTDRETGVQEYLRDRQLALGISQVEDVAALVAFLLSPLARQVNGAAYDIGGTIRNLL